jgi:hypothetical protein
MSVKPYNPLDKENLARSIGNELLGRDAQPLADTDDIVGAGVYVIYYAGPFQPYSPISVSPDTGEVNTPIYVGKAIPKGSRKGLTKDSGVGTALRERLRQHATSVDEAENLELRDFWLRYLTVEDIWIPLGERVLIETFRPLWNRAIDGFGNKDPGRRRATQFKSPWDVLHPGRAFADKLADSGLTEAFLVDRVADYLAGRKLKKLPKRIEEEVDAARAEAEEAADEAEL